MTRCRAILARRAGERCQGFRIPGQKPTPRISSLLSIFNSLRAAVPRPPGRGPTAGCSTVTVPAAYAAQARLLFRAPDTPAYGEAGVVAGVSCSHHSGTCGGPKSGCSSLRYGSSGSGVSPWCKLDPSADE
jgi:hypothetical protein